MKKWKCILSAVLALGMLTSVTSCGASEEESSPANESSSDVPVLAGGDVLEGEISVPDLNESSYVEEETEAPTENNSS